MKYGPTAAEAAELARKSRCKVTRTHPLPDGEQAYSIECSSHKAKVELLLRLAAYDAEQPAVRRMAERIAAGARDSWAQIEALHRYVRDRVVFTTEPVETFSPTMHTLEVGLGDCDDSARALAALLLALGHKAGLQTLGEPPLHVAAGVEYEGKFQWLETTMAAHPGEHPVDAAKRLGVKMRPDIVGSAHNIARLSNELGQVAGPEVKIMATEAAYGALIGAAAMWASGGKGKWPLGLAAGAATALVAGIVLREMGAS